MGSVLKVLNLSPSSDQKNALYHVVCLIMCCRFSFIYVWISSEHSRRVSPPSHASSSPRPGPVWWTHGWSDNALGRHWEDPNRGWLEQRLCISGTSTLTSVHLGPATVFCLKNPFNTELWMTVSVTVNIECSMMLHDCRSTFFQNSN